MDPFLNHPNYPFPVFFPATIHTYPSGIDHCLDSSIPGLFSMIKSYTLVEEETNKQHKELERTDTSYSLSIKSRNERNLQRLQGGWRVQRPKLCGVTTKMNMLR